MLRDLTFCTIVTIEADIQKPSLALNVEVSTPSSISSIAITHKYRRGLVNVKKEIKKKWILFSFTISFNEGKRNGELRVR